MKEQRATQCFFKDAQAFENVILSSFQAPSLKFYFLKNIQTSNLSIALSNEVVCKFSKQNNSLLYLLELEVKKIKNFLINH